MRHFVFLTTLLLFCGQVYGQGWYIDMNAGGTYADTGSIEDAMVDRRAALGSGGVVSYKIRNTDNGGSLALGYRATPHWALEVGFMSLGAARVFYRETETTEFGTVNRNFNDKYATSLYHASAVGVIPLGSRLELLPRVGLARWRLRYRHYPFCDHNNPSLDLCAGTTSYSDRRYFGNSIMMGAALRYAWTRGLGIKMGWDFVSNVGLLRKTNEFDGHLLALGIDYRFFKPAKATAVPEFFQLADSYVGLGASANIMPNADAGSGYQFLLGYRFPLDMSNLHYALELGYMDSGEMADQTEDIVYTAAGAWFAAVAGLELHPDLDTVFRFGADFGDDRGALYGIGLRYDLGPTYALELDQITRDNIQSTQLNLVYYMGGSSL